MLCDVCRKEIWRRLRSFSRSRRRSCRLRLSGAIGSSCHLFLPRSKTPPSPRTSPASGPTRSWCRCTTSYRSSSSACISSRTKTTGSTGFWFCLSSNLIKFVYLDVSSVPGSVRVLVLNVCPPQPVLLSFEAEVQKMTVLIEENEQYRQMVRRNCHQDQKPRTVPGPRPRRTL